MNKLISEYKDLYNEVNNNFYRIDIPNLIDTYNNLLNINFPTESESLQKEEISAILSKWIKDANIDKLHKLYMEIVANGGEVKSPNKFLIGPQR